MKSINIHEAKTNLSKLVEMAANGEPFVIAKAGKPMVKVSAIEPTDSPQIKRFGFMANQIMVPADFNSLGKDQIEQLFTGDA